MKNENWLSCGHLECVFEEVSNAEIKNRCKKCCMIPGSKMCKVAPCARVSRTDKKTGYFTF